MFEYFQTVTVAEVDPVHHKDADTDLGHTLHGGGHHLQEEGNGFIECYYFDRSQWTLVAGLPPNTTPFYHIIICTK